MQDKYILQYGSLAGWPYKVAHALREKGVNSKNVIFYDKDVHDLSRNLPYDGSVCHPDDSTFKKIGSIFKFIEQVKNECSIVHYHSSNIFFRELHCLYEGPKFRKAGIPMLISFGGGDARFLKQANELNPYFYKPYNRKIDNIIKLRYSSWKQNIRFCATDPELGEVAKPYFDKVFTFRQPVILDEINFKVPDVNNTCPRILHIPTEPKVKGTEEIIAAVENLKKKGHIFEFVLKRQLTQKEVYQEISNCDVYVDELRCGSHGVTAVETMAAGKPTVTFIREDLIDKFPEELPLVNANPDTIEEVLEELILDAQLRHNIGKASRAYVEKYHDSRVVADDLIEIYKEIEHV